MAMLIVEGAETEDLVLLHIPHASFQRARDLR